MTLITKELELSPPHLDTLMGELRQMIEETRRSVASTVNAGLALLYWHIGNRVRKEILNDQRAEYGQAIVSTVSRQLMVNYGKGFSDKNLRRMMHFGEAFPEEQIVRSLLARLSWSHFTILIPIKDPIKRDFYAEMCRIEQWNVRTLSKKIDSMLFERTALSKKPDELIQMELNALRKEDQLSPDLVFKDPYVLEFLDLNDHYMEKDLEDAIMRELEQFLLELGIGFSFIARQKRIIVDNTDYYIDLLFFHRRLKRLVAIELKLGDFKPGYKGQMELYLRWLDKYEKGPGEEPPMGLILCTGKNQECIELLELDKVGIHVAEYLTSMPSKEELLQVLKNANKRALLRVETKKEANESISIRSS